MENKDVHLISQSTNEDVEVVGMNSICRLCANQDDKLIGVFSEEGITNEIATKINLYLPVKVDVTDELPLQCCWNCASTILAWHELVLASSEADRRFRASLIVAEKPLLTTIELRTDCAEEDNKEGLDSPHSDLEEPKDPLTCDICKRSVSRARDLKRHKITCHLEPPQIRTRRKNTEITARFFCDVCRKGFTRKHDMEKHRSKIHNDPLVEPLPQSARKRNMELLDKCRVIGPSGALYHCDFCQQPFAQTYNLIRHRTIHTGVRAHCCHLCGKSFRISTALSRHITEFHNRVRKFTCEVCKKGFSTKGTLAEHMNTHTNNRPYVCDVCGKCYKQKATLHVHKMFHSEVFRFKCESCGKEFRRAQELKVHTYTHTRVRPFACKQCNGTFKLKYDLKRHMKTHCKARESTCVECGSSFSQERYLKIHMKTHQK